MLVTCDTRGSWGGVNCGSPSTERASWQRIRRGCPNAPVRTGRRADLRAIAILLATLSAVVQPATAVGADHRHPEPTRLWRAFPLKPALDRQAPHAASNRSLPSRPAQEPAVAEPDSGGGAIPRTAVIVVLAGGASVALALALLAARPGTTTKGVGTMSNFIRRRSDGQSESKSRAETADETAARPLGEAVTSYTLRQPDAKGAPSDDSQQPDAAADTRGFVSYDELGQTIANVLRAAEDNAAQLLAAAHSEAQSIRDAAELEANETRAQLEVETAERRSESERIRADANKYAEERRRAADLEAQQTRSDAETEAKTLREAGEGIRRSLEEKGLARRQELIEASSSMEARLQDALTTCREVAAEIEELLSEAAVELDEDLLEEVREVERPTA
jgi:hypothetical protein